MVSNRECSAESINRGRNCFFAVIVFMYLPRIFRAHHNHWSYSFNPCVSFKMGSSGDCDSDVAVSLLATVGNY